MWYSCVIGCLYVERGAGHQDSFRRSIKRAKLLSPVHLGPCIGAAFALPQSRSGLSNAALFIMHVYQVPYNAACYDFEMPAECSAKQLLSAAISCCNVKI